VASRPAPRFGLAVPIFAGAGGAHVRTPLLDRLDVDHLRRALVEAESLGYDSLWVADHFQTGREAAILECWTFMSWVSRVTTTMRIGSIHLAHLFRNPALTAKLAATLDHISGGRLEFFYEAGSPASRREVESYGFGFLDDADRMAAFEEAVRIVKLMWTEDRPSFRGRFYSIDRAVCYPRPIQKPHPPVWIGTFGDRAADPSYGLAAAQLGAIAKHADGWNSTPVSVDDAAKVLKALSKACSEAGRPFSSLALSLETEMLIASSASRVRELQGLIERRNPGGAFADWARIGQSFVIGDPPAVTRKIEQYVELGISRFMIWFMDYPSLDGMRTFAAQVMPYFRGRA